MVTELPGPNSANPLPQDVDYAEHSAYSRAKKVITGPLHVPRDPGDETKNIDPINGSVVAAADEITLLRRKSYRVVSSTDCFIRMTLGTSVALITDVYLPANQPIVLVTLDWDTLGFIRSTADGIIQAVEVK